MEELNDRIGRERDRQTERERSTETLKLENTPTHLLSCSSEFLPLLLVGNILLQMKGQRVSSPVSVLSPETALMNGLN